MRCDPQLNDAGRSGDGDEHTAADRGDEEGNPERNRAFEAKELHLDVDLVLQNENDEQDQHHECAGDGSPDHARAGDLTGFRGGRRRGWRSSAGLSGIPSIPLVSPILSVLTTRRVHVLLAAGGGRYSVTAKGPP